MGKKFIYCINCGEKNSAKNKKCTKCKKKLNQKDLAIFHYVLDYAKDETFDNLFDVFFGFVKNLLLGNFYGVVLVATAIFSIAQFNAAQKNNNDVLTIIDHKLALKDSKNVLQEPIDNFIVDEMTNKDDNEPVNSDECKNINGMERVKTCKSGYTMNGDKCVRDVISDATKSLECSSEFFLSGSRCLSKAVITPTETQSCELPSVLPAGVNPNKELEIREVFGCQIWQCSDNVAATGECEVEMFDIPYTIKKICPDGYSLVENDCHKTETPSTIFSCSNGVLDKDKCTYQEEISYTLECPSGYKYDSKCKICKKG